MHRLGIIIAATIALACLITMTVCLVIIASPMPNPTTLAIAPCSAAAQDLPANIVTGECIASDGNVISTPITK